MSDLMKPLHVYDGDCGFCQRWISHWRILTGDKVDYAPYQEVAPRFPNIPVAHFQSAVHLIEPDSRVSKGAEAVLRTLAYAPDKRWMLWMYRHVPGLKFFLELGYRIVARNRTSFSVLTQWLWGNHVGPATYQLTRWVFLRMLGVVYLVAFASLAVQAHGLIGQHGILPVREFLMAAQRQLGPDAQHLLPTLFWFNSSDLALTLVCLAGMLLSVALIIGIIQLPALIGLWVCYLSLTVAGQEFLSFQWDILLLEAGFLSIFFCPLKLGRTRPYEETPPSQLILWLMRWLLFRLMFGSGMVKFTSGDQAWADLTALTYHYQTQPLPNPVSWYFHQFPVGFHVFCVTFMFIIELIVPFLIFTPRRIRMWGCGIMIFFQLMIIATGNYAFFNYLTIVLCFLLFDDAMWPDWVNRRAMGNHIQEKLLYSRWRALITIPVTAMILFLSTTPALRFRSLDESGILVESYRWLSPFRLVNSFGLFAVMTTRRPEIIIEGSPDGERWATYEFKYKPGDVMRPPPFVAPYQPRLDWQMWFAALSNYRANPWFIRFCQRLLEGSSEVTALLKKNPFPDQPPHYIRATLYDYRFTTLGERGGTRAWWSREKVKLYCPILSLK